MPAVNYSDFAAHLIKKNRAFFLYGEESFQIDSLLKQIVMKYTNEDSRDFDYSLFYADDTKADDVLEVLNQSPFINDVRLVVIKEFDKYVLKDKNKFADYLQKQSETSVIVIISEKKDNVKAYATISDKSISVQCKKPYSSREILAWVQNEVRSRKIKMDNNAATLFAGMVDLDYLIAGNELEKLLLYTAKSSFISENDVLECTGKSRNNTIFDLQNAIGARNLKSSFNILENMLNNNESGVFIIVMLTRFFTLIWKVVALRQKNYSDSMISEQHLNSVYKTFRNDYFKFADKYPASSIYKVFSTLLKADTEIKSINIKESLILEMMLYNILRS